MSAGLLARLRRLDGPAWGALALGLACVALMVAGAFAIGTSWDENDHRRYGEMALRFYRTLGGDREATESVMRYYGALHALAGALAERLLPGLPWPSARHLAVVAFSAVGFVYAVRLARLLAGPWAGLIAALLLATTPRWVGDSMFNPVDIPTAGAFSAAAFYLARLARDLSAATTRDWLRFGIASGLTLAVRLIGLLCLPFACALALAWALTRPAPRGAALREHGPRILRGLLVAALACALVAMALWPRLLVEPMEALADSLGRTQSYPWPGKVLFRGEYHSGHALPRSYLAVWLWITTPLATLLGLAGLGALPLVASARRARSRDAWLTLGIVLFALVFPPAYASLTHATIYDGIRHFLFLLPPLSALAAVGWVTLIGALRGLARPCAVAVLALLAGEPLLWYARSHPLEYVYFNPLVGGLKEASRAFDTDYWGLSLRAAAEWMSAKRVAIAGPVDTLLVTTNAPWHLIEPWLDDPARYRKVEPTEPLHLILFWCRDQDVGWEQRGTPLKRNFVLKGQVPFWQAYAGTLFVGLPPRKQ